METHTSKVPHVNVDELVREKIRQYLGVADDSLFASTVIADLGIDSIVLVTILTDLFVQLNLDPGDTRVKLGSIKTLGDVISLLSSLLAGESGAADTPPAGTVAIPRLPAS